MWRVRMKVENDVKDGRMSFIFMRQIFHGFCFISQNAVQFSLKFALANSTFLLTAIIKKWDRFAQIYIGENLTKTESSLMNLCGKLKIVWFMKMNLIENFPHSASSSFFSYVIDAGYDEWRWSERWLFCDDVTTTIVSRTFGFDEWTLLHGRRSYQRSFL